jgi:predicted TIM-barrel fold metal-dependent hydrolase
VERQNDWRCLVGKSDRRKFMQLISGVATACVGGFSKNREPSQTTSVPSSRSKLPHTKAPPNAADCHHHIYDSRFPIDPKAVLRPGNATVADYRSLQARIGTTRNVVVQPSTYGVDNRCLLDALGQFGLAKARGIAVVNDSVSDAELRRMDTGGVRGIRFNLLQAGSIKLDMLEPLSKRVAALGWHVQINASAEQIATSAAMWNRIPVPVVFDHLGHVSAPAGNNQAFGIICDLLHSGKAWVKISGIYLDSNVGPPSYADAGAVAKAYIKEAPERLVWGTDWPYPTAAQKPDGAVLFDLLADWAPEESKRTSILVDNAAKLYGFA